MPLPASTTRPILPASIVEIDALTGDFAWHASALTFSFPGVDSAWSTDFALGYGSATAYGEPWHELTPISTDEQAAFREIIKAWSTVSGVTFIETADTAAGYGTLRVARTARPESPFEYAWAYFPSSSERGGDIWLNRSSPFASNPWTPGSSAYYAVLHEVGHALGLKHPFGGSPTLAAESNTLSSTMMAYDAWPGVPQSTFDHYPTTPMRLDIAAIQHLYGPPALAAQTDTRYRFDDMQPYHQTIWDAGGVDTIAYEGTLDVTLDLRPGHGSMIGQAVNAYASDSGALLGRVANIWTAFDTVIEKATLGSGDDTLIAHESVHELDAGEGLDTLVLPGQASDYLLARDAKGFSLSLATSPQNAARLTGIERYQLDNMRYATDLASDQSAGQALLAIRSVAPQYLADPETTGYVIRALDGGLSLSELFSQLDADGTIDALLGGAGAPSLARYLATNIAGSSREPEQIAQFEQLERMAASRAELLLVASFSPQNIDYLTGVSDAWIAIPYL